jgi:hypothetical protein
MAGPDISAGSMLIVLQKIPIIGDHFIKEIPPSDNVGPMSHRIQPVLSFCHLLLGRPWSLLSSVFVGTSGIWRSPTLEKKIQG